MKRKPNANLIDADNPEWTSAEAADASVFSELTPTLQTKLTRRARGAQLAPTKERVSIRLSPTVVETFRATGAGWQTRIDAALLDWLETHTM